jgi:Holliday junction resolvasome RuvABC endonuclease subunit
MTPILVAVDPQTPGLGVCVLHLATGDPLHWGWTPLAREGWIHDRVREAVERTRPEDRGWDVRMVSVERPRGGRGVQSMLTVAEVAGQVAQACRWRWPEAAISRPEPSAWKKQAGLSGNARKAEVLQLAEQLVGAQIERQDVADAVVMAWGEWRACAGAVAE